MNPLVGDLEGNLRKITKCFNQAVDQDADIVAFPEMVITGYPPEDLLLKREFVDENLDTLERFIQATKEKKNILAVVGFVDKGDEGALFNAAAIIYDGQLIYNYHKILLPNYGVFDERRYFEPGCEAPVLFLNDIGIGVSICEDVWHSCGPSYAQASRGANLILSINASPYHVEKWKERLEILRARAVETARYICYLNMVGGQDELVFDGHSFLVAPSGELIARGQSFNEEIFYIDLDARKLRSTGELPPAKKEFGSFVGEKYIIKMDHKTKEDEAEHPLIVNEPLSRIAEVYSALVLGTRDYVIKNGFKEVVIGLSGGIDSALTAAIAVDALGSNNVHTIMMPSQYTSNASRDDAIAIADNFGMDILDIGISDTYSSYLKSLEPIFREMKEDATEENIQARIRGNLLMAASNKFGWLLLTTGNKSEMSVGYCTLYGDMSGGFAVLKDVIKTDVYALCKYRNNIVGEEEIPERVLERAPSAELKADQKDTDTLPEYDILDPILQAYVERDESPEEIIAKGFDEDTVQWIIKMVDRNEYKRRQAPPGIKITKRAFGKDRRMPITNGFNH